MRHLMPAEMHGLGPIWSLVPLGAKAAGKAPPKPLVAAKAGAEAAPAAKAAAKAPPKPPAAAKASAEAAPAAKAQPRSKRVRADDADEPAEKALLLRLREADIRKSSRSNKAMKPSSP